MGSEKNVLQNRHAKSWWLTWRKHWPHCLILYIQYSSTSSQPQTWRPDLCSRWQRWMSLRMWSIFSRLKENNNYLQHGLPIKAYNLRPSYRYLAWLRGTTKPTFILHFAERPFWSNKGAEEISWSHLVYRRLSDIPVVSSRCSKLYPAAIRIWDRL